MSSIISKCLFCQSTEGPFTRDEHPIPESLGNYDLILPSGMVCDFCNQYFGAKVEGAVLSHAPFNIERAVQAIRNKKGKRPIVTSPDIAIQSTGYWDRIAFQSRLPHRSLASLRNGKLILKPKWPDPNYLVRFLLKVGLELFALADYATAYESSFDAARRCARFGTGAQKWDFAIGLYPDRSHLFVKRHFDEYGPLETRQVYECGLGRMESGDLMFSFVYATWVFAVNLSRPPSLEYILCFNELNSFHINSRWRAFSNCQRSSPIIF